MRIEEEFGGSGMLSMFVKRISSQISQLTVRERRILVNRRIYFGLFRVLFRV